MTQPATITATEFDKEPTPNVSSGWGIIGPYGNVWSGEIFETPELAWTYLKNYWRPTAPSAGYRVVGASKTITVDRLPPAKFTCMEHTP